MAEGAQDLRDPSRSSNSRVIITMWWWWTRVAYTAIEPQSGRLATDLLLITPMNSPRFRLRKGLSYWTQPDWPLEIKLIVNRYQRDVGLSREVIGTALHTESSTPCQRLRCRAEGADGGKPIPPSSPFGKSIQQLADRLSGHAETSKKSSSPWRPAGLFTRTTK